MGTTLKSRDPLANRESSIRFNQYNTSAMALIDQVGGDVAVLETQWKWEDLALELRNYCESIARRLSGTQSASQELLVSGLSESEPEVVSRAPLSSARSKGKQRAVVQDESSQDDLESSSDEETDLITQAPRTEFDQDLDIHDEGDLEVDEGQEGDYDGEETASEAEDRRDQDRKVEAVRIRSPCPLRLTDSVACSPTLVLVPRLLTRKRRRRKLRSHSALSPLVLFDSQCQLPSLALHLSGAPLLSGKSPSSSRLTLLSEWR